MRTERDDALYVDTGCITHLRHAPRGLRVVAEACDADQPRAGAGGIRELGEIRSQGDNAFRGRRKANDDTPVIAQLDGSPRTGSPTRCAGVKRADAQGRGSGNGEAERGNKETAIQKQ